MASSASAATAPRSPPVSRPSAIRPVTPRPTTSSSSSSSSASSASSANEAILRNALRYTISAREYAALHKYVLSRSRLLRRNAPSVDKVKRIMNGPSSLPPSTSMAGAASTSVSLSSLPSTPTKNRKGAVVETDKGGSSVSASSGLDVSALTNLDTPQAIVGADDFNARAVRHALRVFVVSATAQRVYEALLGRLTRRGGRGGGGGTGGTTVHPSPAASSSAKKKGSGGGALRKSPVRVSLSLSAILLFYRLLFRFFTRLRTHLLDPAASPFRTRNPRTSAALTSPYAPAAGASLAGLALGIAPAPVRMSLAVMAVCRALEFVWNAAEDSGAIWGVDMVPVTVRSAVGVATSAVSTALSSGLSATRSSSGSGSPPLVSGVVLRARVRPRPWWWGSWLLQPFAFGQLLHAAVFDRDCFPQPFGNAIFNRSLPSDTYLHPPPADAPGSILLRWPGPYEVLDALAAMAHACWPPFASPILFPLKDANQLLQLPAVSAVSPSSSDAAAAAAAAVAAVTPLTSRAHPLITSFSCATLHPADPSCGRTFLMYWLRAFPANARLLLLLYTALQLPRLSEVYHAPVRVLQRLVGRALRSSAFLTGSLSTAWASVCFFQTWLPRRVLPTQRFFLGGFVAGLWAWLERRHGHALFLYSARASLDSMWRVGVERRWWRPASQGTDVLVFVASLLMMGAAYEREARAVREPTWRQGISWMRGEGWRDWAVEEDEEEDEEEKEEDNE